MKFSCSSLILKIVRIVIVILLPALLSTGSSYASPVILECRQPVPQNQPSERYWYLHINDVSIGSMLIFRFNDQESGEEFAIYHVDRTKIIGRSNSEKAPKESHIHIDRLNGYMKITSLYTKQEAKNFWNEKKGVVGQFEDDVWLTSEFNCTLASSIF